MAIVNTEDFLEVLSIIERVQDYTSSSLPQFTKPAVIESPIFIDDAVAAEKALPDIIKSLYNIYIGYILTAVNLNQRVTNSRTVRDMTSVISTSSYLTAGAGRENLTGYKPSLGQYVGNEELSLGKVPTKKRVFGSVEVISETAHEEGTPLANPRENPLNALGGAHRNVNMVDMPKNVSLPDGRIIEIFFSVPDDGVPGFKNKNVSLKIFVKLNPRFISNALVEYIVAANFNLPLTRKLLKLRAGEMKFFRDFIFQVDQVEKRKNALKHDRDNSLKDIFAHQRQSFIRRITKTLGVNQSQNIFNSILILEEKNFLKAAHSKGFNFKDTMQRQKFFNLTASLFIVLVDPQYGIVKLYTNGINQVGEYTYNSLKSAASSDKMGVAEIIQMLEQSKLPKF